MIPTQPAIRTAEARIRLARRCYSLMTCGDVPMLRSASHLLPMLNLPTTTIERETHDRPCPRRRPRRRSRAAVAADVVRISVRRLHAWEVEGLVVPASRTTGSRRARLYRFDQLVEMCIIRELEDRGQDIRHIRFVVERHQREGVTRPLLELQWGVDGGHLYTRHPDGVWTGGKHYNQSVMPEVIDIEEIRSTVRRRLGRTDASSRVKSSGAAVCEGRDRCSPARARLSRRSRNTSRQAGRPARSSTPSRTCRKPT